MFICLSVCLFVCLQGFNQLSELAMLTKFDVDDIASEEDKRKILHAVSLLKQSCKIS